MASPRKRSSSWLQPHYPGTKGTAGDKMEGQGQVRGREGLSEGMGAPYMGWVKERGSDGGKGRRQRRWH